MPANVIAKPKAPSPTARTVAYLRAQHQIVDKGSIFPDPLAAPLIGVSPEILASKAEEFPQNAPLRQFIAARSRFAEDCIAKAVDRGVRQVVVLGAGLDTFGLRNPYRDKGLRVFDVDRLAAQRWKQRRIAKANVPVPAALTFVTVDFEKESFLQRLASSRFDEKKPAVFVWLGVVPYLSRDAVSATLAAIVKIPDAEIVFDYCEPVTSFPPERRVRYERMIKIVELWGEPWVSFFTPAQMKRGLTTLGFREIEDLGAAEVEVRYPGAGKLGALRLVRAHAP